MHENRQSIIDLHTYRETIFKYKEIYWSICKCHIGNAVNCKCSRETRTIPEQKQYLKEQNKQKMKSIIALRYESSVDTRIELKRIKHITYFLYVSPSNNTVDLLKLIKLYKISVWFFPFQHIKPTDSWIDLRVPNPRNSTLLVTSSLNPQRVVMTNMHTLKLSA